MLLSLSQTNLSHISCLEIPITKDFMTWHHKFCCLIFHACFSDVMDISGSTLHIGMVFTIAKFSLSTIHIHKETNLEIHRYPIMGRWVTYLKDIVMTTLSGHNYDYDYTLGKNFFPSTKRLESSIFKYYVLLRV